MMYAYNILYFDLVSYVVFLCSFIPVWVFLVLGWQVSVCTGLSSLQSEDGWVEFFWTVIPSLMVVFLCFFNVHCMGIDVYQNIYNVVKIIGRQWYWSYELGGSGVCYDSLMTDFISSVDKPLRVSLFSPYIFVVTSSDVLHSFAIPSFNLKVDAIPGRINQLVFCPDRLGVFVGYCSELCGAGHAFMPIVMEVVKG